MMPCQSPTLSLPKWPFVSEVRLDLFTWHFAIVVLQISNDTHVCSFPDMTIEYDMEEVNDGKGGGVVELEATVMGTFTGADFIFGDKKDAIIATRQAVSKQMAYTFTFENEKIVKLVIVGLNPVTLYDEVAVATD